MKELDKRQVPRTGSSLPTPLSSVNLIPVLDPYTLPLSRASSSRIRKSLRLEPQRVPRDSHF